MRTGMNKIYSHPSNYYSLSIINWRKLGFKVLSEKNNSQKQADICIIVEGCYPFIPGGVSSWVDWLMRTQPDFTFSVVAIMANDEPRQRRYEFPDNMIQFEELFLHEFGGIARSSRSGNKNAAPLSKSLISLISGGGLAELDRIEKIINKKGRGVRLPGLMNSELSWKILSSMYEETMPQSSFHHFFWAWRSLFGGMFSTLKFKLPAAKVYHTISTGYAGLLAARAGLETNRPVLITEHGIYTNERRIEIMMADWIADTVDKGLSLDDRRFDLRDMWIGAFESYARACYQSCAEITTLYEDNQILQRAMGAEEEKLTVIANGVDYEKFAVLPRPAKDAPPTLALIGRVVPIKDIKNFITACALTYQSIPDLKVFMMGPMDEDAEYYEECRELVTELQIEDCFEFTGTVQITDYMPLIDIVVLTSLSEAQPLVLLEAGAAGIPCISTDVGSCREIIEGRSDEVPNLGHGGIVVDLVSPQQVAEAAIKLFEDPVLRHSYGQNLKKRVKNSYLTTQASAAYTAFYTKHCNAEDRTLIKEDH